MRGALRCRSGRHDSLQRAFFAKATAHRVTCAPQTAEDHRLLGASGAEIIEPHLLLFPLSFSLWSSVSPSYSLSGSLSLRLSVGFSFSFSLRRPGSLSTCCSACLCLLPLPLCLSSPRFRRLSSRAFLTICSCIRSPTELLCLRACACAWRCARVCVCESVCLSVSLRSCVSLSLPHTVCLSLSLFLSLSLIAAMPSWSTSSI